MRKKRKRGETRLKKRSPLSLTEGPQENFENTSQLIHIRSCAQISTPFAFLSLTVLQMGTQAQEGPFLAQNYREGQGAQPCPDSSCCLDHARSLSLQRASGSLPAQEYTPVSRACLCAHPHQGGSAWRSTSHQRERWFHEVSRAGAWKVAPRSAPPPSRRHSPFIWEGEEE